MFRQLTVFLIASCVSYAGQAQVAERFQGTWTLDMEATIEAVDALIPPMSPDRRQQMDREMPAILASASIRITASTLSMLDNGRDRGSFPLTLQEEIDGREVFSAGKMGTLTLRLDEAGLLNLSATSDDDMDVMWWAQQATAGGDLQLPNSGVAFLDGLKSCSPGDFQISYPGFGTSKNTIIGQNGDRCQVRIEHSQISLTCNYSDATIALLTSEAKYEDARNGVLSGSTGSEESQRVAAECIPD